MVTKGAKLPKSDLWRSVDRDNSQHFGIAIGSRQSDREEMLALAQRRRGSRTDWVRTTEEPIAKSGASGLTLSDVRYHTLGSSIPEEGEYAAIEAAVRPLRVIFEGRRQNTLLFKSVDTVSNDHLDNLMEDIESALGTSNNPLISRALNRWHINAIAIVRASGE